MTLVFAPAANNLSLRVRKFLWAALWKGVLPYLLVALIFAPAANNLSIIVTQLLWTAI